MQNISLVSPTSEEVRHTAVGYVCAGKSLVNNYFCFVLLERCFDSSMMCFKDRCVLLIRALEDQIFES
jgi:hypothetical protein